MKWEKVITLEEALKELKSWKMRTLSYVKNWNIIKIVN